MLMFSVLLVLCNPREVELNSDAVVAGGVGGRGGVGRGGVLRAGVLCWYFCCWYLWRCLVFSCSFVCPFSLTSWWLETKFVRCETKPTPQMNKNLPLKSRNDRNFFNSDTPRVPMYVATDEFCQNKIYHTVRNKKTPPPHFCQRSPAKQCTSHQS